MGLSPDRKGVLVRVAIVLLVLVLALPIVYCCGIPLLTQQVCYDFLSGHVPPRAVDRFLERLFEATVDRDYAWLATVTSAEALQDLQEAQPLATTDYEVLCPSSGMYERRIQFTNGATVYITLDGQWPTCPDFRVTEEEIFENIRLSSFRVESEG